MMVSLPTQRDRLGLGAMQVDKVTGHVISHQLSDMSRPAILFQQEQPGLLCMRPGSAESRVSAVLLLGTSSPSRQFILAQVQDETLTSPPPPPRLGGPWLLFTLPCTALEGKHMWYQTRSLAEGKAKIKDLPRASQGKEEVRFIRPWLGVRDKRGPSMPGHNLCFVIWVGICVARS